jgi:WD40 repeat protein
MRYVLSPKTMTFYKFPFFSPVLFDILIIAFGKVYAVDWSPDGEKVASGGKDRVLKLWMG